MGRSPEGGGEWGNLRPVCLGVHAVDLHGDKDTGAALTPKPVLPEVPTSPASLSRSGPDPGIILTPSLLSQPTSNPVANLTPFWLYWLPCFFLSANMIPLPGSLHLLAPLPETLGEWQVLLSTRSHTLPSLCLTCFIVFRALSTS